MVISLVNCGVTRYVQRVLLLVDSVNYNTMFLGPESDVFAEGKALKLRSWVAHKLKFLQIGKVGFTS